MFFGKENAVAKVVDMNVRRPRVYRTVQCEPPDAAARRLMAAAEELVFRLGSAGQYWIAPNPAQLRGSLLLYPRDVCADADGLAITLVRGMDQVETVLLYSLAVCFNGRTVLEVERQPHDDDVHVTLFERGVWERFLAPRRQLAEVISLASRRRKIQGS
jgi:hypothetical protein